MVNYKDGKVYEIVCNLTGGRYIGSTTQRLSSRLNDHRKSRRKTVSSQIIEKGDFYINLLEDCPCDNLEQLLKKEREWYDKLECINKYKPHCTKEERKEYERIHSNKRYHKNKDTINQAKKETFVCSCGVTCRIADKARHYKSKKHIKSD